MRSARATATKLHILHHPPQAYPPSQRMGANEGQRATAGKLASARGKGVVAVSALSPISGGTAKAFGLRQPFVGQCGTGGKGWQEVGAERAVAAGNRGQTGAVRLGLQAA